MVKFQHSILDRAESLLERKTLFGETSGNKLGAKLEERFRYFLKVFITVAISVGATVPLAVSDDKEANVQTFVKHGGPKHIVGMLKSNMDKTELMRCTLALLIVTVNLLRNKQSNAIMSKGDIDSQVNETEDKGRQGSVVDIMNKNKAGSATSSITSAAKSQKGKDEKSGSVVRQMSAKVLQERKALEQEQRNLQATIEWTTLALHSICDAGKGVSTCVAVLIHSSVPSVQQLSVTLMALLGKSKSKSKFNGV